MQSIKVPAWMLPPSVLASAGKDAIHGPVGPLGPGRRLRRCQRVGSLRFCHHWRCWLSGSGSSIRSDQRPARSDEL
jgi:hypothetical protein